MLNSGSDLTFIRSLLLFFFVLPLSFIVTVLVFTFSLINTLWGDYVVVGDDGCCNYYFTFCLLPLLFTQLELLKLRCF